MSVFKKLPGRLVGIQPSVRQIRNFNIRKQSKDALSEAEKIVGYPTSFLNLRWLLSDEIANVAFHLRKLTRTNHPLLGTAKSLLVPNDAPPWGLIVLLVSKAAGLNKKVNESEHDRSSGVLHSQRALAEVTEMIRTSNRLHKSLLNYTQTAPNPSDLNFGNKVALLSGDYLLSSSYHQLACIKNQELNEIMSSALRDLVEADFLGPCDDQNRPLPCRPDPLKIEVDIPVEYGTLPLNTAREAMGHAKSEWILRNVLGGASLLAKSCQGAFMLAGFGEKERKLGYLFGRYLALSWQASLERNVFQNGKCGVQNLISAPVLFHLQFDGGFYDEIQKGLKNVEEVDLELVQDVVLTGPGIRETRNLQEEFRGKALELLEEFRVDDAKRALENIIISI